MEADRLYNQAATAAAAPNRYRPVPRSERQRPLPNVGVAQAQVNPNPPAPDRVRFQISTTDGAPVAPQVRGIDNHAGQPVATPIRPDTVPHPQPPPGGMLPAPGNAPHNDTSPPADRGRRKRGRDDRRQGQGGRRRHSPDLTVRSMDPYPSFARFPPPSFTKLPRLAAFAPWSTCHCRWRKSPPTAVPYQVAQRGCSHRHRPWLSSSACEACCRPLAALPDSRLVAQPKGAGGCQRTHPACSARFSPRYRVVAGPKSVRARAGCAANRARTCLQQPSRAARRSHICVVENNRYVAPVPRPRYLTSGTSDGRTDGSYHLERLPAVGSRLGNSRACAYGRVEAREQEFLALRSFRDGEYSPLPTHIHSRIGCLRVALQASKMLEIMLRRFFSILEVERQVAQTNVTQVRAWQTVDYVLEHRPDAYASGSVMSKFIADTFNTQAKFENNVTRKGGGQKN